MKKLLLKIFVMMLFSMGLVFGISRIALLILQQSGSPEPKAMYYISLISGLCGLILFAFLLNFFVIRRLKRLSAGVNEVAKGNYKIALKDKGMDEVQTLVEDFNRMTNELKSNEYLSREFIKNVSHELKTPLSTIMGYSELLNKPNISDAEKAAYAQIINDEAKRMLGVGRQMLEISKLDSSEIIKQDDIFRADEQIRNIIIAAQNDWVAKNINIDIDMPEIEIKNNEELTFHIWQNLINNAVKYTEDGGKISITLKKTDKLNFCISNTGKGISEQAQPYVFNQFYTVDKSNGNKGTGLGLSIVKKITEKLNGKVWFESFEGGVTSFFVELS